MTATISPAEFNDISRYGERYASVAEVTLALANHDTVDAAVEALCLDDLSDLHRTCLALHIEVPDEEDPAFYDNDDAFRAQVPRTVNTMMEWALSFEN